MRKKTAAAILSAGLIAGGGVALAAPGLAVAAGAGTSSSSVTDRATARLSSIKDALKGLVSDGTINQSQADKVASTLAQADLGGPGGPGRGGPGGRVSPQATAKVIGITVDELRTAEQSGKTLAQIAAAHNVSKGDLISGLVAAAKAELAADVTAGRITQAQADQVSGTLTARITERVDQVGHGPGAGPRGDHDGDGPAGAPGSAPPAAPSTAPSTAPAPSATTS